MSWHKPQHQLHLWCQWKCSWVTNSRCFSQTSSSPPGSGSVPPPTWPPGPVSHTPSPGNRASRGTSDRRRSWAGPPHPTTPLTCVVTALRPRPSSSRSSSEPADKHSEKNPQSMALVSSQKQRDLEDHLRQTRVGSRTVHPKQRGSRSSALVHRLRSPPLNRLKEEERVWKCLFRQTETLLSPRSSSASCVSTLKSRNQVSSQATTNDVIGNT